ncbi:unnamed protein product [Rotaria magnacalcarata]|nr:unnamed protein product [Rotaria magnacalcarata]
MKSRQKGQASCVHTSIDSKSAINLTSALSVIWMYQSNIDPWNDNQNTEWTPYSDDVSVAIENAFNAGAEHIFIDDYYQIDLKNFIQINTDDVHLQRRVRRQNRISQIDNAEGNENKFGLRERLAFPLDTAPGCSTTIDTLHRGSPFIQDWILTFTHGNLVVTFDCIFPALVEGLKYEGQTDEEPQSTIDGLVKDLNDVQEKSSKKKEHERIQMLEDMCAKLYTKDCYVFRIINTALRDNNLQKLHTLGPYCYLLYNYIGRANKDHFSIHAFFWQKFHSKEPSCTIVYRGDYITNERIKEYSQAAGNKNIYFKWLPFVSTSKCRDVADSFGQNVTYVIKLRHRSSHDQFTFLNQNTYYPTEEEILLRPGTRFRVTAVKHYDLSGRSLIHIKILPSYVSYLR